MVHFHSSPNLGTVIHPTVTVIHATVTSVQAALEADLEITACPEGSGADTWTTPMMARIQPVVCQLQWFQDEYRVCFKVLVLALKAFSGLGPMYLWDHHFQYFPQRALHSELQNLLVIPGPKDVQLSSIQERAFLAMAPA